MKKNSSYVLTLPKEWVEALVLRKGMGVTVVYDPGILRVFPMGRRKRQVSSSASK